MAENAQSTLLVIFGITGDLSHRYLLPALAQITTAKQVGDDFKLLGISRREVSLDEIFAQPGVAHLKTKAETLKMDYGAEADYQSLKAKIDQLNGSGQVIFYFAVPPEAVLGIVQKLGQAGLNTENTKLLLEKPFGVDLPSAQDLIKQIDQYYKEAQVFRIDHYMAKEMAQNITVFLGSNSLIRNLWDNRFIESVEVIVAEQIGIEGRGELYEHVGALRDVIQSHALQLAALVLMEPCSDLFDFEEMPKRRLSALQQLELAADKAVVRGQYETYRAEVKNPSSSVETFVSVELASQDPRWQGVPIRLTTGKSLDQRLTEIRVYFKKISGFEANKLTLRIQPKEGIELDLWIKEPGYERKLQKLPLNFAYEDHFGRVPNAYEQVLIDAMRSNHSLFASSAEVLASWQVLQPVLDKWAADSTDLKFYKAGSHIDQVLGQ